VVVAIVSRFELAPFDESDPDDHRPNSRWALLIDPGNADVHVDDITVIVEEIAPGDRIPLHTHPISEVIVIDEGSPEVTLGDDTREVDTGSVVFIPAGTPHATRNATKSPVRIHAMFPSERMGIEYIERNPAPGTESDPPQPASVIDARAFAEG
jgi:quercetin dioxygenase-like cupin family protein